MFPWSWRGPFPMPVAAQPTDVRDYELVFKYLADQGGQCCACNKSFREGDPLVAVGMRDSDSRTVLHENCWKEAA